MKRRQFLEAAAALPLSMAIPPLWAEDRLPAKGTTTEWVIDKADLAQGKATLYRSVNGRSPAKFLLRGVCYSPCPINGANSDGPNLGDWFWDTFGGEGYKITGWQALWDRDFPNLKELGVNTIRVYCMLSRQINNDGTFPKMNADGSFPKTSHLFTHNDFLDKCWDNGISVLVGIPLPDKMYWLEKYDNKYNPENIERPAPSMSANERMFWEGVLAETVATTASHPAVLGYTIQNELDGDQHTFTDDPKKYGQGVEFWWSQMEKMAAIAKKAMGNNKKLVGMANHESPRIPGNSNAYMAKCPSIDFWGVNSYQTVNFDGVFNDNPKEGPGYNNVPVAARKPVIFTEYGMPATSHSNPNDPGTIYDDASTIKKAADVVGAVIPHAFSGKHPLCLGLYYFEYSDEWWNQAPYGSRKKAEWYGEPASNPGFPNGYWDNDGFGIFKIKRGEGKKNTDLIWNMDPAYGAPTKPIDQMIKRTALFDAIKKALATLPAT